MWNKEWKKGIDYPAELDSFDTPQSVVCAEYAMKLIRSSFGNTGINLEEDSPTSLVMRKTGIQRFLLNMEI